MLTAELHGIDIPVRMLTGPELRELLAAVDISLLFRLICQSVTGGFFYRRKIKKLLKTIPIRYLLDMRRAIIRANTGGAETVDELAVMEYLSKDGSISSGARKLRTSRRIKMMTAEKYESYFAMLCFIVSRLAGVKQGNVADFVLDFEENTPDKELTPVEAIARLGEALGAKVTDTRPKAWNMEQI